MAAIMNRLMLSDRADGFDKQVHSGADCQTLTNLVPPIYIYVNA